MNYKLRNDMTRMQSRFATRAVIKYPCAKKYSQCTREGGQPFPIYPGLKNPNKEIHNK